MNSGCRWLIVIVMQLACLQVRLSSILAQSISNFLLLEVMTSRCKSMCDLQSLSIGVLDFIWPHSAYGYVEGF
jgi:hypothetical protein